MEMRVFSFPKRQSKSYCDFRLLYIRDRTYSIPAAGYTWIYFILKSSIGLMDYICTAQSVPIAHWLVYTRRTIRSVEIDLT